MENEKLDIKGLIVDHTLHEIKKKVKEISQNMHESHTYNKTIISNIHAMIIWLILLIVGGCVILSARLNKIEDQITRIEKLNHVDSLEKLDKIKSLVDTK